MVAKSVESSNLKKKMYVVILYKGNIYTREFFSGNRENRLRGSGDICIICFFPGILLREENDCILSEREKNSLSPEIFFPGKKLPGMKIARNFISRYFVSGNFFSPGIGRICFLKYRAGAGGSAGRAFPPENWHRYPLYTLKYKPQKPGNKT